MAPKQKQSRFIFSEGEDTYASQTAQDPQTSRRVLSWIPAVSGELTRQADMPRVGSAQTDGAILSLVEYAKNNPDGSVTRYRFAATSQTLIRIFNDYSFAPITDVGTLAGAPMFAVLNNLLHMDDGQNAWIYDGNFWVRDGFPLPWAAPFVDVSQVGTLTVPTSRFYWTTFADETDGRVHESSSSPISLGTGNITNKTSQVFMRPGTASHVTVTTADAATGETISVGTIVGNGTDYVQNDVGMIFYSQGDSRTIVSVQDSTHLTLSSPFAVDFVSVPFLIAPSRATHWHLYASEVDNSKIGYFLASIPVSTYAYLDQSPFIDAPLGGSLINPDIERPLRNDPPITGGLIEVHKNRIFRRRGTRPNFFVYSANEEVGALDNGDPRESYPGTDAKTLSDLINEESYPDQSNRIRALKSHSDGLYIGTERSVIPFYGSSLADFAFTQVHIFGVGVAGRFAMSSTPHGLAFVSYDRKVYLYPSTPWKLDMDMTSSLMEIGRPLRRKLEKINAADLDNVRLQYYSFGRRNWLLLTFQDTSGTYQTWAYDFEAKGWLQLSKGFSSLAIFEIVAGNTILIGGTPDGKLYVIDDLTGTFVATGTFPEAHFKPALMDFADATSSRQFQYVEYELTNQPLDSELTVYYWLDPVDVDNVAYPNLPNEASGVLFDPLAKAGKIIMQPVGIGANLFRGFPYTDIGGGTVCNRLLIEIVASAGVQPGAIRGLTVVATPLRGMLV